jgi:hypothetical protein
MSDYAAALDRMVEAAADDQQRSQAAAAAAAEVLAVQEGVGGAGQVRSLPPSLRDLASGGRLRAMGQVPYQGFALAGKHSWSVIVSSVGVLATSVPMLKHGRHAMLGWVTLCCGVYFS